jgi:hypothetical protein
MSDTDDRASERGAHDDVLEDALRSWLTTNWDGDAYMTGYAIVVTGVKASEAGRTVYSDMIPTDQPVHATLGLTEYLYRVARGEPVTSDDK